MKRDCSTSDVQGDAAARRETSIRKRSTGHLALVLCLILAGIGAANPSQAFAQRGNYMRGGHFGRPHFAGPHTTPRQHHNGGRFAGHGIAHRWQGRDPIATHRPDRPGHRAPTVPINTAMPVPPASPPPPAPPPRNFAGASSGVPARGETRFVPNEVLFSLRSDASARALDEILRRHRLVRLSQSRISLIDTTVYRFRIADGRSVAAVIRALEAEQQIAWTQPNYIYKLEGKSVPANLSEAQYALEKLHLIEAHRLAEGDATRVAVIDSGIDASHPELAGAIAETFDAIDLPVRPEAHGTAIAGLIAAHAVLTGVAPHAKVLAIRVFSDAPARPGAEGTSIQILAGIDFAVAHKARIINMSFAGPSDPLLAQVLAAAHQKGEILVAAAGNEGPNAAPLYPAADPNVIAVTATDPRDRLFANANRGAYIRVAAPGTDILVAAPFGNYQFSSGTSMAAAEVSGVIALMLSLKPDLDPDTVRAVLVETGHQLAASTAEGAGPTRLSDAYAALAAIAANQAKDVASKEPASNAATPAH
jgi:hypothetical protein